MNNLFLMYFINMFEQLKDGYDATILKVTLRP